MPKTRLITVNGNAGLYVDVLASINSRRVEVVEDEGNGNNPQGLSYKQLNDSTVAAGGFTDVFTLSPGVEPIVLGNSVPQGGGFGATVGFPANTDSHGNAIAATKLLSLLSMTAAGTVVRVTEYE